MRILSVPFCLLLASCLLSQQEEWTSVTIDARSASGFTLVIKDGKVIGGHDTCNGWGLSDQPGLIVMTAQECPSDKNNDAYWALVRGEGATYDPQGAKLIAKQGRHIGVFRRS